MTDSNASAPRIRHIALFRLAPGDRSRDIDGMRARLVALVDVIPGLRSMVVEPSAGLDAGNWDLALVSEHDDAAAFATYQAHPAHHAASAVDDAFILERAVVDIELRD